MHIHGMRSAIMALVIPAAALLPAAAAAQAQARVIRTDPRVEVIYNVSERALLGLQVSNSSTPRDTLGLLVTQVVAGGAAEKAGIAEGSRITSINGVNLKLSPLDAGQSDMTGIMARRLNREVGRVRRGDTVVLGVFADGRARTVNVVTDAPMERVRTRVVGEDQDRATIGAIVGGTSSARDTLGVFVSQVAENGPLAKAGVFEGSRIASINGVDLRVPRARAAESAASAEKSELLVTELGKVSAGTAVSLRVYDNGRFRDVSVTTMRRADVDMPAAAVSVFGSGGSVIIPPTGSVRFNNDDVLRLNRELRGVIRSDSAVRIELGRDLSGLRVQLDSLRGLNRRLIVRLDTVLDGRAGVRLLELDSLRGQNRNLIIRMDTLMNRNMSDLRLRLDTLRNVIQSVRVAVRRIV